MRFSITIESNAPDEPKGQLVLRQFNHSLLRAFRKAEVATWIQEGEARLIPNHVRRDALRLYDDWMKGYPVDPCIQWDQCYRLATDMKVTFHPTPASRQDGSGGGSVE